MSWRDGELTTLALCWRLERRDGIGVGLTAHDRDLMIDGNLYRASPGMTPSAIERADGADGLDVVGAMTAGAITERDLLAGRWDGARVCVMAIDWRDIGHRLNLASGTIGAVETEDGGFTAELRGNAAALDRPVSEETSPTCRAMLGDRRCRVPMAGRRRMARVIAAEDAAVTLDVAEPVENGWGGGRLRWFGGANSGLEDAIASSAEATVMLLTPPRFTPAVGNMVQVIEGCDKTIATCSSRFANAANFRGEPYLPGIDLLTRYPGA